jgi:hypothetical protein
VQTPVQGAAKGATNARGDLAAVDPHLEQSYLP